MAKFQGIGGLVKTEVLEGKFMASAWIRWLNLIAPRLTSPVTNDPPATATSAGIQGEIRQDASFIYVCTATNVWKRSPLSTF